MMNKIKGGSEAQIPESTAINIGSEDSEKIVKI